MTVITPMRYDSWSSRDAKAGSGGKKTTVDVLKYGGESEYVTLTILSAELCHPNTTAFSQKRCKKYPDTSVHARQPAVALLAFAEDDKSIDESTATYRFVVTDRRSHNNH